MKRVTILGCGLVGSLIAKDLSKDPSIEVTACDLDPVSLEQVKDFNIIRKQCDLADKANVVREISNADCVVSAVPGHMGFETVKTAIENQKTVVDISFMPENQMLLDDLAKKNRVCAIVDCGVSPGLSNLFMGRAVHVLDEADAGIIYVGGLPVKRSWPYEYNIVFSAIDVIEEYTRPARFIEAGRMVIRPALSDIELIDLPGTGTLECFNSDGLRTLIDNIKIPYMKEKTCRWPGHAEKMAMLRETGFFSQDEIDVKGKRIKPIDFTAKLLFRKWELPKGEKDLTVLRVKVSGKLQGENVCLTWDMLDQYDEVADNTSMARTTGYPCSIMVSVLIDKIYFRPGVIPLELLASEDKIYTIMLNGLSKRNVIIKETKSKT